MPQDLTGIPSQGGFPIPGGGGQQGGFPFPGGGGQQGGFPFPGGGGQQGGFPSPGGGKQTGAPTTPPPSVIPQESVGAFAVDPGAIRRCLFRFTYVWLNNGRSFWLYPTFVGRNSVAGFRWRRNRWEYYGTDLRRIRSFRCF
ncbi:MAG TPA: hypothetical protein VJ546_11225 [Bacillales bacterium]|nr:hypothetical protein [Bacillales bacterium]